MRRKNKVDFFSAGEAVIIKLRADLRGLLESFSGDEQQIREVSEFLISKYNVSSRFYHNLSHVAALLSAAEKDGENYADFQSVKLAIWFHDVVYEPRSSENEIESARAAVEKLSALNVTTAKIRKIERIILATQKHDAAGLDADGKMFLDLDLSILGVSAEVYQHYKQAIRREYSFVSEALYRRTRARILTDFLQRDFIYLTAGAREKFEAAARQNVAAEIAELSE